MKAVNESRTMKEHSQFHLWVFLIVSVDRAWFAASRDHWIFQGTTMAQSRQHVPNFFCSCNQPAEPCHTKLPVSKPVRSADLRKPHNYYYQVQVQIPVRGINCLDFGSIDCHQNGCHTEQVVGIRSVDVTIRKCRFFTTITKVNRKQNDFGAN